MTKIVPSLILKDDRIVIRSKPGVLNLLPLVMYRAGLKALSPALPLAWQAWLGLACAFSGLGPGSRVGKPEALGLTAK